MSDSALKALMVGDIDSDEEIISFSEALLQANYRLAEMIYRRNLKDQIKNSKLAAFLVRDLFEISEAKNLKLGHNIFIFLNKHADLEFKQIIAKFVSALIKTKFEDEKDHNQALVNLFKMIHGNDDLVNFDGGFNAQESIVKSSRLIDFIDEGAVKTLLVDLLSEELNFPLVTELVNVLSNYPKHLKNFPRTIDLLTALNANRREDKSKGHRRTLDLIRLAPLWMTEADHKINRAPLIKILPTLLIDGQIEDAKEVFEMLKDSPSNREAMANEIANAALERAQPKNKDEMFSEIVRLLGNAKKIGGSLLEGLSSYDMEHVLKTAISQRQYEVAISLYGILFSELSNDIALKFVPDMVPIYLLKGEMVAARAMYKTVIDQGFFEYTEFAHKTISLVNQTFRMCPAVEPVSMIKNVKDLDPVLLSTLPEMDMVNWLTALLKRQEISKAVELYKTLAFIPKFKKALISEMVELYKSYEDYPNGKEDCLNILDFIDKAEIKKPNEIPEFFIDTVNVRDVSQDKDQARIYYIHGEKDAFIVFKDEEPRISIVIANKWKGRGTTRHREDSALAWQLIPRIRENFMDAGRHARQRSWMRPMIDRAIDSMTLRF